MPFDKMRPFVLLLCALCFVSARLYSSDSSSSESDESGSNENQLVLTKESFDREAYLRMKIPRSAETLSGQELVDWVNGRQNLWTVMNRV
jgi:hypothetical protein